MGKNNNLTDFLTDVADAIRSKTGTSGAINPQDFSARIAAIETGGGGGDAPSPSPSPAVPKNDVTFYDYDGAILYSYTKEAFLALSEMPALPSRSGLICQEWNWSFADAQTYVSDYGMLNIGATYITDDGKTRLYIKLEDGRQDVPLYLSQTVSNGVTINWGDGSTNVLEGTGNKSIVHHYNTAGDYVIAIQVADDCQLNLGHASSSYCIMGSADNANRVYRNALAKVQLGLNVKVRGHAFQQCEALTSISIPRFGLTTEGEVFKNCYSLASVVLPATYTVGGHVFDSCYSLKSVILPGIFDTPGDYMFQKCYSLTELIWPPQILYVSKYSMAYCYALRKVVIPNRLQTISDFAFYNSGAISSIKFPSSVTRINANAIRGCLGLAILDFSQATAIPTLASSSSIADIAADCKIVVPDALYDEWIAAANWSTHASKIVKDSEYIR